VDLVDSKEGVNRTGGRRKEGERGEPGRNLCVQPNDQPGFLASLWEGDFGCSSFLERCVYPSPVQMMGDLVLSVCGCQSNEQLLILVQPVPNSFMSLLM
jgi:hypothetical protein